jgi:hypothetical protein
MSSTEKHEAKPGDESTSDRGTGSAGGTGRGASEKRGHVRMDLGPFGGSADAGRDPHALDLTIEQVEERIHPGESNVFDK